MDCRLPSTAVVLLLSVWIALTSSHKVVRRATSECLKKFELFPGHSACYPEATNDALIELTTGDKNDIVAQHNTLRGNVEPPATNMMKMSWDDEVAMIARKWAETCPYSGGALSHDKGIGRFIPGRFSVGQNMAYGQADFEAAIDGWYAETKDYVHGKKKSAHTKPVGHYTQVVWATSAKLGCAKATCSGRLLFVCNYAPAGNLADFTEPYKSGTRASDCKAKDNGLCDCGGLTCENGRDIDPKTCTCDCGSRFTSPECSLTCSKGDESYCNTANNFMKSDCDKTFYSTVTSACPNQCGICPHAEEKYTEGGSDIGGGDGNDGNGDGDVGGNTGDTGDDDDDDNDDDDDDDGGGSSTVQMCLSLILVAFVTTYVL